MLKNKQNKIMTIIFTGDIIILRNGKTVAFKDFKTDGITKIGFYDMEGNEYKMEELC